jgi:hypothetical protein
VINVFAGMLSVRSGCKKIKVFPTEMFTSMYIKNNNVYDYELVKSWNMVDPINQFSILIFPINITKCHWAIIVVFLKSSEMYYIDSLNWDGKQYLKCAFRYIYDEHLLKHGVYLNDLAKWKLYHKGIGSPQQNGDSNNCGIFALLYIDLILAGLPISLGSEEYAEFYRYFVANCFISCPDDTEIEEIVELVSGEDESISRKPKRKSKCGPLVKVEADETNMGEIVDLSNEDESVPKKIKRKRNSDAAIKVEDLTNADSVTKDNEQRAAKFLKKLKKFTIESPTEIADYLNKNKIDPEVFVHQVSEHHTWYIAKHYNSKPLENEGGGICFYYAVSQTLAMSNKRSRPKITPVSLKGALRQGMRDNADRVRQILPEMASLKLADTQLKYDNWVKKYVDEEFAVEHIILLASFLWNVTIELICKDTIYVWDPDGEKEYPKLPTPLFEKETIRILYNMYDHYEAITPLTDNVKDQAILGFVESMDLPLKNKCYL